MHKIKSKEVTNHLNPDRIWDRNKVWRILTAEEYTGAMIMGKRKKVGGNQRFAPRSEWFITPNANEAIVTQEEFEEAQKVIRTKAKAEGFGVNSYPLRGKIRCAHCRCTMQYRYGYDELVWCGTGVQKLKHSHCSSEKFLYGRIESAVFYDLKHLIALVKALGGEVKERQEAFKKAERAARKKQERAELKAESLKAEKMRVYENYADGKIGIDEYKAEKKRLDGKIAQLMKETVVALPSEVRTDAEFTEAERQADIFGNAEKLTKAMADAFIEAVYVHEGYRVEIVYRFWDCLAGVQEQLKNTEEDYSKGDELSENRNLKLKIDGLP